MPTKGQSQVALLGPQARAFGALHASNTLPSASQPAASITSLGKGKIAATYFDFGQGYLAGRSATAKAFLHDLVRQLFPTPMVEVKGSPDVEVMVNRIGGKLAVNLVNVAGPHQTEPVVDTIAPVGPLTLAIRQTARPARVTLEPGARALPFEYRDGVVSLTVPQVEIHDIVMVH
jgi:hypothetical protein